MGWLFLIGRVLFAMVFLSYGLGHFGKLSGMTQYAASKGLPAAKPAVIVSGLMLLAGGLSVLLGLWMEIGIWLLFFFLVPAAFLMHNFWAIADPPQKQVEQAMFMKNISLAGAALMLYWMVQIYGYGPITLGDPM